MKYRYIIIFVISIGLFVAAILTMSDDIMTPYVPFKEAVSTPGKYVQVIGTLDKSVTVKHYEGYFTFTMIDKAGSRLDVRNNAAKPLNFEHAEQIVALGKFDNSGNIFVADKLLVKCPSKYQKEKL